MTTRAQHQDAIESHMSSARWAKQAGMPKLASEHVWHARQHSRAIVRQSPHTFQVGDWVRVPDAFGGKPWIGEIISRDSLTDCWRVEYEVRDCFDFGINVEHESVMTFVGTERPEEVS